MPLTLHQVRVELASNKRNASLPPLYLEMIDTNGTILVRVNFKCIILSLLVTPYSTTLISPLKLILYRINCSLPFYPFIERKIWITDGSVEYHRATSGITRSYPSLLGIMPIHQFRRKLNKYGKTHLCKSNAGPNNPKILSHSKITLGYRVIGFLSF
ncbi:hypothetical protein Hanom_Chr12g01143931 [Helianthus anomalus]